MRDEKSTARRTETERGYTHEFIDTDTHIHTVRQIDILYPQLD